VKPNSRLSVFLQHNLLSVTHSVSSLAVTLLRIHRISCAQAFLVKYTHKLVTAAFTTLQQLTVAGKVWRMPSVDKETL